MFWQWIIVGIVVGLAGASLVRRIYRMIRGNNSHSACGSCGGCASGTPADFVSLEALHPVQTSEVNGIRRTR